MRTKIIAPIIAFIGLGSIVVLGSSPGIVGNFLKSFKESSIAKIFSNQKIVEPSNSVLKDGEKFQKDANQIGDVPENVLWRVIFSLPERLDNEAEKSRLAGEDERLWKEYFIRQAKISPDTNQILRETAERFQSDVVPIDKQAVQIIDEIRSKAPQTPAPNSINSADQPRSTELALLQNQKDELVLQNRDNFRNAIGEEEFAKFSEFLATEFVKGFVRHELKPDELTNQPEGNNGFTPFEKIDKGGDK